jgi:hypothetical protein
MRSLSYREYIRAANLTRQRADNEQNPHAKEIFQELERPYHCLIEIENWLAGYQKYNRPFAHFKLFDGE